MGLTRDWPYSDLHSLNLDWVIETIQQYTKHTDEVLSTINEKIEYIDNFFNNLDVQQEINNKLNEMSESGELARILKPISEAWLSDEMPAIITTWLNENITPGTGVVDASLSVAGAAADARATGQAAGGAAAYAHEHPITSWSRNIFNANTLNKKEGAILNAEVITLQAVTGYTAYVMPISGGAIISTQGSGAWNAHIVILDHYIDITKYSIGDALTGVVDRWHDAGATSRTIPASAKCLILSTNDPAKAMITYGAPASVFAQFAPHDYAIPCNPEQQEMHVGVGRMYPTINDAVTAAPDGATIIVHEGVYNEAVKAWGKTLYIYGVSRDNCILQNDGGDYASPPLEMSSGVIANMTIIAQGGPIAQGAEDKAYCIHMEGGSVPSAQGKNLLVQNVKMINMDTENNRPCAGIGLISDYTLTLDHCDMHSYSGACIYVHDYALGQGETSTEQRLTMINNSMWSDSEIYPVILLQSQEIPDHMATLLAQRNILYSSHNITPIVQALLVAPAVTGTGFLGTSDWALDDKSANNTSNIINTISGSISEDRLIEVEQLANENHAAIMRMNIEIAGKASASDIAPISAAVESQGNRLSSVEDLALANQSSIQRMDLVINNKADASALATTNSNVAQLTTAMADKANATDTVLNTTLSHGRIENSTVGADSVAYGQGVTASGTASHAEGGGATAQGNYSHAEGSGSRATGSYSHAEGGGTLAQGNYSHAEGSGSRATGTYSHAEGGGTVAQSEYSHAEGSSTQATGNYSHAEGSGTQAVGNSSHAGGIGTIAHGTATQAIGTYNSYSEINPSNKGIYAQIIGNGSSPGDRSNAYALDWNGNGHFKGDIYVNCNLDSSGGVKVATVNAPTFNTSITIGNTTLTESQLQQLLAILS